MILYKYLPPDRIDVLRDARIRFTQPADFNDPFEFRPILNELCSDDDARTYIQDNFDDIVRELLEEHGNLVPPEAMPSVRALIAQEKARFPEVLRAVGTTILPSFRTKIDELLNQHAGVLCLSEVRDSILMWGHYTANHTGFAIGFDSEDSFFNCRRTDQDDFGFLRSVKYSAERPVVSIANSDSVTWFERKSEHWAYEKEWRILRVLRDASQVIDRKPFPIHLFDFPKSAVREVVMGMRSQDSFRRDLQRIVAHYPNATMFTAAEHEVEYALTIDRLD